MTEIDVTLTDYLVAALCQALCHKLVGRPEARWYYRFFAFVGSSALVGGTVHGFWCDHTSLGYRILWPICLILLGGSGLSAYHIGSEISPRFPQVRTTAWGLYALYCWILLFWTDSFIVPVCFCLPAMTFWVAAANFKSRLGWVARLEVGVGVSLTFVAAIIQQLGWGPNAYLNHNAMAHLVQALGLWLLYRSARRDSSRGERDPETPPSGEPTTRFSPRPPRAEVYLTLS